MWTLVNASVAVAENFVELELLIEYDYFEPDYSGVYCSEVNY